MSTNLEGIFMRSVSLGYFDVPKCASTSIKSALHQMEFGFPFEDRKCSFARGGSKHIHGFFWEKFRGDLSSANHRIIVVRDPVERFLSAYASRVTGHMELSESKVSKRYNDNFDEPDFIYNPGVGQFLEYLDRYLQERPIEWHLRPLVELLPQGLDQFTRVHLIKRLDLLQSHLSEIYNKKIILARLQTKGRHVSIKQLSSSQLDQIIDFYQSDYELLKPWFSPDQVWNQWKSAQNASGYYSTARRFEESLRLSRTPTALLTNNLEDKNICFVSSNKSLKRSKPDILMDRALEKGGASQTYIALSSNEDVPLAPYFYVDKCRWKVLCSNSNIWISRFWQHFSLLRCEFVLNQPDLIHCYGLRNAALVMMSLSRLPLKTVMVVEFPLLQLESRRPLAFILRSLRLLFVRLICNNQSITPLFQLSSEKDQSYFQKYQTSNKASAYFVPVLDENIIHLAPIDSSFHGVIFVNAYSLRMNEISNTYKLLATLIAELEKSKDWSYLKILMPCEPDAELALLKAGFEKFSNSPRIRIIQKNSNTLFEAQSSQVVVIPSLRSKAARQFIIEAQQLGRPVLAPNDYYGRALVANSLSGYLFSDGEFDLVARNTKRLISARGLPEKMGFKGRLHVETHFTNERIFGVMIEQYHSML